jgi:uncharacterized protein YkwD
MRIGIWQIAATVLALIGAPTIASAQQPIDELQLLMELNSARAEPAAYMNGLREYRGFFHANLLRYPGSAADIATEEGVKVVDETIAYLGKQAPLSQVQPSLLLQAAAADHLADQARTGQIGHVGSDGSSPRVRVQRRGGGIYVAEIIAYGSVDAADAMRQLVVDDGVADRGHRQIIYSGELRYAGVACGPHPVFRTMCVIDLGMTADGRAPSERIRYTSR